MPFYNAPLCTTTLDKVKETGNPARILSTSHQPLQESYMITVLSDNKLETTSIKSITGQTRLSNHTTRGLLRNINKRCYVHYFSMISLQMLLLILSHLYRGKKMKSSRNAPSSLVKFTSRAGRESSCYRK